MDRILIQANPVHVLYREIEKLRNPNFDIYY
jgi:hypothetical protein